MTSLEKLGTLLWSTVAFLIVFLIWSMFNNDQQQDTWRGAMKLRSEMIQKERKYHVDMMIDLNDTEIENAFLRVSLLGTLP